MFRKLGQQYDVIELDQVQDGDEIQDALGKITGARTVSFYVNQIALNIVTFLSCSCRSPGCLLKGNALEEEQVLFEYFSICFKILTL